MGWRNSRQRGDKIMADESWESPKTVSDDAAKDTESSNFRLYRWTCPYCEKSNLQITASSNGKQGVVDAVVRHIRFTDGNGHSPKHVLPTDSVEATILENITSLDGDE